MSTFDYLAGASVERGINEAIRIEEARSHGAELRNLSYRFQTKLNELYDENKSLREFLDIKDVIIEQQAGTIERQRSNSAEQADTIERHQKTIKEIESELEHSQRFIRYQNNASLSDCMMSMLITKAVDNLIETSLLEIIARVFDRHGVDLDEETRNYIKENAKVDLGLAADPKLRAKFNREFRAELLKTQQPGQTPWTYIETVSCANDINERIQAEYEALSRPKTSEESTGNTARQRNTM